MITLNFKLETIIGRLFEILSDASFLSTSDSIQALRRLSWLQALINQLI